MLCCCVLYGRQFNAILMEDTFRASPCTHAKEKDQSLIGLSSPVVANVLAACYKGSPNPPGALFSQK